MKILLLTQVLPYPPDSGPKVKTWNVIKYLAQRHQVTLVSFVRGDQSSDIRCLERYCQAVYTVPMKRGISSELLAMERSLISSQPWMMLRDDRAAMRRLIDRLADEVRFDIVHADQLNMAQYAVRVPDAGKVLDAHNALWLLYKRLWETMKSGPKKWLLGRDWRLIKLYEGDVCREFDAVLAVSSTDQAALYEAVGEPLEITVIPIAVDVDEVAPIARRTNANHILHIGTMYWPPNIDGVRWFVDEVYPRVRAKRPDVCLDVIGANPPKDLMDLNQKEIGIRVTGYVDDPTPFLEETGVMVVPVRAGGGMRVKILNAMAQGLPIVTTTLGCEGIAVESGLHLLMADTPDEFAQAILYLLSNPGLAAEMGDNGRKLVQATYDYRVVCQKIDDIYRTVIE